MKYEVVAEAYQDLEQATGRLMLIDRLAALLALTPGVTAHRLLHVSGARGAGIRCGGLRAGREARTARGCDWRLASRGVVVAVREAGDLGQAAEQLLAATAENRPSLDVAVVVDTLHQIARAEGSGSQGRKLNLLAGLLALATPLEARYLLRLVTGNLRLGIGTPTILDALAQV